MKTIYLITCYVKDTGEFYDFCKTADGSLQIYHHKYEADFICQDCNNGFYSGQYKYKVVEVKI